MDVGSHIIQSEPQMPYILPQLGSIKSPPSVPESLIQQIPSKSDALHNCKPPILVSSDQKVIRKTAMHCL